MLDSTHTVKSIVVAADTLELDELGLIGDDILCNAGIVPLLSTYSMWRPMHLRQVASIHGVPTLPRDNRNTLYDHLFSHDCSDTCPPFVVVFTTLSRVRTPQQIAASRTTLDPVLSRIESGDPETYLTVADESLRQSIIREWQSKMSTANLERGVCAPCGRYVPRNQLRLIEPGQFDMTLLRNDALPAHTRPRSYAFELYDRALLDPAGMPQPWARSAIYMCSDCRREVVDKSRMPRLCLANWLYYAHDVLPPGVSAAFARSSQFDRLLVARARASRISFRFTELRADQAGNHEPVDAHESHVLSQRYVRGNILVMPQNSTHVNSVLPPPASVIRDTVCAVFIGRKKPTLDTIGDLSPLLVRVSTVKTIVKFLVASNPFYAPDDETFFGFSSANLAALISDATGQTDVGVPCALDIGFIEDNEAIQAVTADYTGRNDMNDVPSPGEPLLMDNVGYTSGDRAPVSYRDMKLRALSHCLNGGEFVRSRAGDTFVPDFQNPALLTWLFPHLDPWGIGGFHHPHRSPQLNMEEQLRYLLQRADGRFQRDPDFAFVYFNILQKKAVCDSVNFRVKETERRRIVDRLLAVDRTSLERLISNYDRDKAYTPQTTEETDLLTLVNSVGAVMRHIPGTSGYKLNLRNEIRALVNFHGTPAFFITINPSDVHHPLVRLYAGDRISLEDASVGEELTEWRRKLLVARSPGACAMFFHAMISNFISVILRHGRRARGLFGDCVAYYGTVEAQARGTLHCHMLIWIKGHPSPQTMRDLMVSDDSYQERMFVWLESLIKCEPLGTRVPIHASSPTLGRRPRHTIHSDYEHPGVRRLPRLDTTLPADFEAEYHTMVNDLVRHFNWHEHTATCWKYLRRNQPRVDANCRMRMDGAIRPETTIDVETQSIQLRRLHPWIASYNDLVIFLLQANMDIKHVGSGEGAKALIYYITDYITKASIPAHLGLAALMYAIDRTDVKYKGLQEWTSRQQAGALTILVNSMISRIEISHQQVMGQLIGGGDHYTSDRYRMLHYRTFEVLVLRHWESITSIPLVVLLSDDNVEQSHATPPRTDTDAVASSVTDGRGGAADEDPDNVTLTLSPGSISAVNQQQDYLLRPCTEPFTSMPLYQYIGMTEKITLSGEGRRLDRRVHGVDDGVRRPGRPEQGRGSFHPTHPHHLTHIVRRRVTWVIPVILNQRLPRPDRTPAERDMWARTILTLFIPWRTPGDLKLSSETWSQAYDRVCSTIAAEHRTIISNINVLSECRDARDKAIVTLRENTTATAPSSLLGLLAVSHPQDARDAPSSAAPNGNHATGAELDPPDRLVGSSAPVRTLDELISTAARVGIDNCFANLPTTTLSPGRGTATHVAIDEQAGIAAQHTAMRKLKRKRRPSPRPTEAPSEPSIYHGPVGNRPALLDTMHLAPGQSALSSHGGATSSSRQVAINPIGVIRQVILEFQLQDNPEQLRAFEIVAQHVCFGGPQLLLYIAGVGGTGKSYVVTAILRLFSLIHRRHEVMVAAPTGAAAILIGGYTVHSLLMLPERDGVDLQPLVFLWAGVAYLIVDEVSMISAPFLTDISTRLQHAKGTSALAEDIPFGGVNIIFLGDFGQLKPVGGASLYSHRYTKHPDVQDPQRASAVSALKGVYLWRALVTKVVILRRNQRQSADPAYSALLSRIREGHSGAARERGSAFDYSTLQTRLLQNMDADSASAFCDAPIIVGLKSVRDPLNERILHHHARALNTEVYRYHARDTMANTTLDRKTREYLWSLPTSTTRDALGRLPLFPGMKVMIQENIAFACHVVNGAVGTVRNIKYTETDGDRYVSVVYVEIPGAGTYFGEEHDDVIPIFPASTTFQLVITPKTATTRAQTVSVTRLQPPLLPAYAFTDYKAQGRSLDAAIVDPDSALSMQGVYVMLSRVRTMNGLAILHPFGARKIEERIPQDLRDEFERLEERDRDTREWYRTQCDQQT